jgi:hypothetical protein
MTNGGKADKYARSQAFAFFTPFGRRLRRISFRHGCASDATVQSIQPLLAKRGRSHCRLRPCASRDSDRVFRGTARRNSVRPRRVGLRALSQWHSGRFRVAGRAGDSPASRSLPILFCRRPSLRARCGRPIACRLRQLRTGQRSRRCDAIAPVRRLEIFNSTTSRTPDQRVMQGGRAAAPDALTF